MLFILVECNKKAVANAETNTTAKKNKKNAFWIFFEKEMICVICVLLSFFILIHTYKISNLKKMSCHVKIYDIFLISVFFFLN